MASKEKTILMEQDEERAEVLNYLKENKMLLISVDPGYDGFKIYINNREYLSKSLVVEIGKSDDFEDIKLSTIGDGSFVQMRDFNSGKVLQYATGKNAQEDLIDEAVDISNFYANEERFSTPAFRASFYSAVIRALWCYSKVPNEVDFSLQDLNDLSSWKIWMIVTVPHAYKSEAEKNIRTLLSVPVDARIRLSRNVSVTLPEKLPIVQTIYYSQALAAFHGQYTNECGEYSVDFEAAMQEHLPALLIDAGYHTCAILLITKALKVLNGNATDASGIAIPEEVFSMEEFDKETAKRLRNAYTTARISDAELSLSLINDYCNGKRTLFASTDSGSVKVDVAAIRAEVLNDAKNNLIKYLDRKFGMKKVSSAFITGGTGGSVMFDYLSNILTNWQNIEQVNLITGKDIDHNDVGSVFGVSYGAYKILVGLVRADAADKE